MQLRTKLLLGVGGALGLIALGFGAAWAAIPNTSTWGTLPYSGTLALNGTAVSGNRDFCFKLFDDPTASGTHELWSEQQSNVSVATGLFSVELGAVTPLTSAVETAQNLYLQVGVADPGSGGGCAIGSTAGFTMLGGRQAMGAVPFALSAARGIPGRNFTIDGQLYLDPLHTGVTAPIIATGGGIDTTAANGTAGAWIELANGTLVCYARLPFAKAVPDITWNFPKTFTAEPLVIAGAQQGSAVPSDIYAWAMIPTTAHVDLYLRGPGVTTQDNFVTVAAIGSWR